MRRKLLALLLTLALLLGLLAVPAMAADDAEAPVDAADSESAETVEMTEGEDAETADGDAQTPAEGEDAEIPDDDARIPDEGEDAEAPDDDAQPLDDDQAEEATLTSGACGENLTWTLEDGVLTISGTGAMDDYFWENAPWYDQCSNITSVNIETGVASIGEYAFEYCESLASVIIPNSVTSIGDSAFESCTSLTSVTIPDSVTSIGNYAFAATGLTSVTIPNSVTAIQRGVFNGCDSLTSVAIPDSVTSIGNSAFAWAGLASVTIPNSVTSIQYSAFNNCDSLTSVIIPNSVQSIGEAAFGDCNNLTTAIIGSGVTELGERAFFNDPKLTNITIGNPSAKIGTASVGLIGNARVKPYENVENAVIYGYTGSTSQSYANNNTVTFVAIDSYTLSNGTVQYEFVIVPEASNTTYVIGSGGSITIYCTGEYSKFVRLLVDGQEVDPGNYQLAEGSTVITLISAYLDTLSVGKHTVDLVFANGTAQTTITILARGSGTSDRPLDSTPQTGDDSMLTVWIVLAVISLAGMAATVLYSRRIRH